MIFALLHTILMITKILNELLIVHHECFLCCPIIELLLVIGRRISFFKFF